MSDCLKRSCQELHFCRDDVVKKYCHLLTVPGIMHYLESGNWATHKQRMFWKVPLCFEKACVGLSCLPLIKGEFSLVRLQCFWRTVCPTQYVESCDDRNAVPFHLKNTHNLIGTPCPLTHSLARSKKNKKILNAFYCCANMDKWIWQECYGGDCGMTSTTMTVIPFIKTTFTL